MRSSWDPAGDGAKFHTFRSRDSPSQLFLGCHASLPKKNRKVLFGGALRDIQKTAAGETSRVAARVKTEQQSY